MRPSAGCRAGVGCRLGCRRPRLQCGKAERCRLCLSIRLLAVLARDVRSVRAVGPCGWQAPSERRLPALVPVRALQPSTDSGLACAQAERSAR